MTMTRRVRTVAAVVVQVFLLVLYVCTEPARGHAGLDHADPKVGATLAASPTQVRIWFDSDLEPVGSTLKVMDRAGRLVDNRDGCVNSLDATLLQATLPRLAPGSYRVIWSVTTTDGHRTSGDYSFVVK